jgi:GNAT superfamily N-acetyltransferase
MLNYYIYLALARGRSDALLREAEAAGRAEQARLHRRRAGASGGRRSALRRLFRRLRPAWATWGRRAGRAAGRRVVLRDGSKVVIRPVRGEDAPLLADGFTRLGPESRRLRFLRRKDELSAAELRYFTDVDHHDHEALGALEHTGGRGVGIARYIRDADDPHAAEIAVTVVDDWQGRGLGTELLAQLSGRARAEGIRRFHRPGLGRQQGGGRAAAQRQRRGRPPRARHRGVRDPAGALRGALRRSACPGPLLRRPCRAWARVWKPPGGVPPD